MTGSTLWDAGPALGERSLRTPDELRRRAMAAARSRLLELKTAGRISEPAYKAVEDDLRRIELRAFLGRHYPG